MILLAESSAILSWLLGEDSEQVIERALEDAESVLASDLALVECERVLVRAAFTRRLESAEASHLRRRLREAAANWTLFELGSQVLERSKQAFPHEPVRTLDALHLATALEARRFIAGVAVLTLDQRIRSNAESLGLPVLPV